MDARPYPHAALTAQVIGAFYDTYNVLGHGFVESAYEASLALELEHRGLAVERQREPRRWGACRKVGAGEAISARG